MGSFDTVNTLVTQATTSQQFHISGNMQGLRITWRQLTADPHSNPIQPPFMVEVLDANLDVVWCSLQINLFNIRNSDIVVPVLAGVSHDVVVRITEVSDLSTTHRVYVTGITDIAVVASMIVGSSITQPVRLAQVGNSNELSSFGEVITAGFGSQDIQTTTANNAVATIALPQVPGLTWHVNSISASVNQDPQNAPLIVQATDGFGVFSQYFPVSKGLPLDQHWSFVDGGLSFLQGAGVNITMSASGSAGTISKLSAASILR
jgi:hypothetical protein